MSECGRKKVSNSAADPCGGQPRRQVASPACAIASELAHFDRMIDNCCDYAASAKAAGKPLVGIMCEFTPREIILAAGAVPICLCGGSCETIAAAEEDLPANLCPLIKSTYGYHKTGGNPLLEMADLLVAETTCDGKKKMYELMAQTRPMFVLELPQKQDDLDARKHWLSQVTRLKRHLEDRFSVTITDNRLRQAISLMNRERSLRCQLAALMMSHIPQLTGRQLLQFRSSISGIEADLEQYSLALQHLKDVSQGENPPSEQVRVLLTGVPMVHGAERVLEIIESSGGVVVSMENCTGIKPLIEDIDASAADPLAAIAEKYYHLPCSVMTANKRRLDLLRQLTAEFRPHCIIELTWHACLTYDVEAAEVRGLCEKELDVPYLHIQTDYSPSDSPRIALRVEALFETIRSRLSEAQ